MELCFGCDFFTLTGSGSCVPCKGRWDIEKTEVICLLSNGLLISKERMISGEVIATVDERMSALNISRPIYKVV